MRIVVIGGSGHIGGFLVPRLVRRGFEVISISRGQSSTYHQAPEWEQVRQVAADRVVLDEQGVFAQTILELQPDVVVDLVCFTVESAQALVDGLRGKVDHLLHCGSVWRYGHAQRVPILEGEGTPPFDEYGIAKQAIAELLKAETAAGGLVTTSIHPGHIVGPGWAPITPLGNFDESVWTRLSAGEPLQVPGSGAELLHHVHADDVAQQFELAIIHRDEAAGEDFHAVSPAALSVRGYAEIAAGWFGQQATLESVTWDRFGELTTPEFAHSTWGHLVRSHGLSIAKAERLLGYTPTYSSEAAILESLRWLDEHGQLELASPLVG